MAWQQYVALGDSLTAGVGDRIDSIEHLSWADRLAAALGQLHPGFVYHNLAVRGKTSAEIIAEQLPQALSLRPDLVTILAGGNDLKVPGWTPDQFSANLRALVEPLLALETTVVLCTMIDNWHVQPPAMQAKLKGLYVGVRAVNSVVRDTARAYGLPLLDLEQVSDLHDLAMISADGIHANSYGYIKIAAEAARQFSAITGVTLAHPALDVPDLALEKHRVFRAMLAQFEGATW